MNMIKKHEAAVASLALGDRTSARELCTEVAEYICNATDAATELRRADRACLAGFTVGKEPFGWRVAVDEIGAKVA